MDVFVWDRETAPASKWQLFGPSWFGGKGGLVSFGSPFGHHAGVVKRVAGVGGGAGSASSSSSSLPEIGRSPKLLPSRRKSADPTLAFRGIVVSRQMSCLAPSLVYPCRGLAMQRVAGVGGGARTCAGRGDACLSASARRRMDARRCIWLRGKGMRLWWSSFWRRGRSRMRSAR